jgi:hypothetical protein
MLAQYHRNIRVFSSQPLVRLLLSPRREIIVSEACPPGSILSEGAIFYKISSFARCARIFSIRQCFFRQSNSPNEAYQCRILSFRDSSVRVERNTSVEGTSPHMQLASVSTFGHQSGRDCYSTVPQGVQLGCGNGSRRKVGERGIVQYPGVLLRIFASWWSIPLECHAAIVTAPMGGVSHLNWYVCKHRAFVTYQHFSRSGFLRESPYVPEKKGILATRQEAAGMPSSRMRKATLNANPPPCQEERLSS